LDNLETHTDTTMSFMKIMTWEQNSAHYLLLVSLVLYWAVFVIERVICHFVWYCCIKFSGISQATDGTRELTESRWWLALSSQVSGDDIAHWVHWEIYTC